MKKVSFIWFAFFVFLPIYFAQAQKIPAGWTMLEEVSRRNSLLHEGEGVEYSYLLRPLDMAHISVADSNRFTKDLLTLGQKNDIAIQLLPIFQNVKFVSDRSYGLNLGSMSRSAGWQSFTSAGIKAQVKFLHLQLQPEFLLAQNSEFLPFVGSDDPRILNQLALYYRVGNQPDRLAGAGFNRFFLGNSSLTARLGSVEAGVATAGLFWGPGQFSSLTFGNAAPSFPYVTINTFKPAKTFLGNIEFQVIAGVISPFVGPMSDNPSVASRVRPFELGDKYVNAISFTISPKGLTGLHLGFNRSFQESFQTLGSGFRDLFPIFMGVTKENTSILEQEIISGEIDGDDQQISVFARYLFKKANAELYFEFGKRDHNLNWREFILNPDHARAYLLGFNKLFALSNQSHIQLRSELLHQQESINRIVRYPNSIGITWSTHAAQSGFGNLGQNFGSAIGTGSNSQILEVAWVKDFSKLGLLFERVERNNDFYYAVSTFAPVNQPWVDLSSGLVFSHQYQNLIFSGRLQAIRAFNYQWQGSFPTEPTLFPASDFHKTSFLGLLNLMYHF